MGSGALLQIQNMRYIGIAVAISIGQCIEAALPSLDR